MACMPARLFGADVSIANTALTDYHREKLNARLVDFVGYSMPVLYEGENGGVKNEHLATR